MPRQIAGAIDLPRRLNDGLDQPRVFGAIHLRWNKLARGMFLRMVCHRLGRGGRLAEAGIERVPHLLPLCPPAFIVFDGLNTPVTRLSYKSECPI
jgi:hypothetical protein